MSKKKYLKTIKNVQLTLKKHSPEILTGIGITGMITTTIMAVKATPKAIQLLDEEIHWRIINNYEDDDENIEGLIKVPDDKYGEYGHYRLPVKDTIKTVGLCYLPAALTGVFSIVCIIGASSINFRRNAALATAYALSENALKEYQEKVIENIGIKKEEEVRKAIIKDKVENNIPVDKEVIIADKNNVLCLDLLSGRFFESDIDKIKEAVNELNFRLIDEMYIPLNDFYYEIGLENTKTGEMLGWNIENGKIDISFSSQLNKKGQPCLVIDYKVVPQYDYR